MSSVSDLINMHNAQYGRPQGGQSAFGALADIVMKRQQAQQEEAMKQRQQESELQRLFKEAELKNQYNQEQARLQNELDTRLQIQKQKDELAQERLKHENALALKMAEAGVDPSSMKTNAGVTLRLSDSANEQSRRGTVIKKGTNIPMSMAPAAGTPIPSSNPYQQLAEANKARNQQEVADKAAPIKESAQNILNTIGKIEKGIRYFGAAGNIPAFPAEYNKQDWSANVDKLTGELVLKVLNDMKAASKTGASGFGSLSGQELELLKNAATSLKKGASEENAQMYLNEIKARMQKVLGEDQTSDEQNSINNTQYNGASQNGQQFQEGQTATNPATGQKIVFRNGQWVSY